MPLPVREGIIKNKTVLEEAPTLKVDISSLDGTLRYFNILCIDLVRRPARDSSSPIQHDPLRLSRIMDNFELLSTASSKIYQFSLARLERMRDLARSGEPVELSRMDVLLAEFC